MKALEKALKIKPNYRAGIEARMQRITRAIKTQQLVKKLKQAS